LISCQFALHYAFETEEKAKRMLQNVSDNLEEGFHWIGTIPDAYWIVKKLRSIEGLEFGNDVYNIRFEQKEIYPTFGHKYWFYLKDGIDDCPEYLLHFPTLVQIAKDFGLQLVKKQKFHEFIRDNYYPEMLQRMKVFNQRVDPIPEDQWEAIGIYMIFVFKKVTNIKSADTSAEKELESDGHRKIEGTEQVKKQKIT
jgi:mRNA (guanine-N7-)-methyltransferase